MKTINKLNLILQYGSIRCIPYTEFKKGAYGYKTAMKERKRGLFCWEFKPYNSKSFGVEYIRQSSETSETLINFIYNQIIKS
jgi:hypothetical protein